MTEPKQTEQDVHYFWPQQRIDALRMYARDESEPADKFALSKRLAWMREFCIDAPSWLQSFEARERLRNKAAAAHSSVVAAGAQLELLLEEIDAMGAPDSMAQDRWAAAVTNKTEPLPQKGSRKLAIVAEADAPDPDKPKGEPKVPAPGEKLPSEQLWDAAHGKKPGGKSSLRAELDKLAPDAKARVLGQHAPAAPKAPSDLQLGMRKRAAELKQSIAEDPEAWESPEDDDEETRAELQDAVPAPLHGKRVLTQDEAIAANIRQFAAERQRAYTVVAEVQHGDVSDTRIEPNPDDLPPDEQPRQQPRGRKVPVKTGADFLAERQKAAAAAKPAPRAATVKVKKADGTEQLRAPRTGFRMELDAIAAQHGDDVATFVAHDILKDVVNTRMIRRAMGKFKGTFPTRDEASLNCAEELDKVEDFQKDVDVLRAHAGHFLEHEDGRCSWWRK